MNSIQFSNLLIYSKYLRQLRFGKEHTLQFFYINIFTNNQLDEILLQI